jgi:hypothetical protein
MPLSRRSLLTSASASATLAASLLRSSFAQAKTPKRAKMSAEPALAFPPVLPGEKPLVTNTSDAFPNPPSE